MAKKKKFFNTKVKSKRKQMTKWIIIGSISLVIVILSIIVFIISKRNTPVNDKLLVKKEVSIEINETMTDEMLFTSKNPDLKDVNIIYPDNFSTSNLGNYEVTIKIGDKEYTSKVKVIDSTAPVLKVKPLVLTKFDFYTPNNFVESCTDNSGKECIVEFYTGVNQNGEEVNYGNYMKNGKYDIKIVAKDEAGNETVKSTTLTIGGGTPEVTETCEYGDSTYDSNNYILASIVASNNCALNPNKYDDDTVKKNANKILATETQRIKKDLAKLNLDGSLALNRTINIVLNNAQTGLVGYEIIFTVTVSSNGKSDTVAEFKIDSDNKRVFVINKYDLPN